MCVNKQTELQKPRHYCQCRNASKDSLNLSPAIECLPKALPAPNEIHKAHFTAARQLTKLNVRFMQSGIFEAGRKGLDNPHKSSSVSLSHK